MGLSVGAVVGISFVIALVPGIITLIVLCVWKKMSNQGEDYGSMLNLYIFKYCSLFLNECFDLCY